jgi:hypothetical protein
VWRCPLDTAAFNHASVAELAIGFGRIGVAERMHEMHAGYKNTRNAIGMLPATVISLCFFLGGCSSLSGPVSAPFDAALKVVVGPVILERPHPKSTQIHSFSDDPSPEFEPVIMAQLVDELQTKAQQILTEQLAHQRSLVVVPFDETRRMLADIAPAGTPLTAEQIDALASQSGADVVITGLIHDYGKVRWQYWVTGLAFHATTELLVVGFASGWNPAIVVPFFSSMWREMYRFGTAVRMCSVGLFDLCRFIWRLYRFGTVEVLCGAKMRWQSKCREKLLLSILQMNNQRRKFSWKPISSTSWRSSRKPSRRS